MRRLHVLAVHYRYPELLHDQAERIGRCAGPVCAVLSAELRFHPILHRHVKSEALVEAVQEVSHRYRGLVDSLDLRDRPMPPGGMSHGYGLVEAYRALRREGLGEDDLIAVLDHDTHPLNSGLFATVGAALLAADVAGVGIPQWGRGHWFLHPSLLVTHAATLERIGLQVFLARPPAYPGDRGWWDTAEGFTRWCEANGRGILPLRFESNGFPWKRPDSDEQSLEIVGWHGETLSDGYLMRYGLEPGHPLVSHLRASPLGPFQDLGVSDHTWDEVLAAYLAEPFLEAGA